MHRTSRVLVNLFGNTYTRSIYGNRPLILGIETSCDDTGAAVLSGAGKIYGEAISSQLGKHVSFGGVIPPLAAEMHRQNIEEVVTRALTEAQFEISDLDAISVTNRPGLPICLSVGLRYAKHLARKHKKPLIPVHHMKAHALMARIENDIDFPFLCLLVSGGHCLLAVAKDVDTFAFLGESQDNAPGEVFDKIARRLKLRNIPEMASFSGGQAVEIAASQAQNMAFEYPLPMARSRDCMFTFSGIMSKTYRYIKAEERKHGTGADEVIPSYRELSASALHSVIRHIAHRTHRAMIFIEQEGLIEEGRRTLVVSGGVACNNFLFEGLQQLGKVTGYRVFRPSKRLCTDNGVMIAWTGVEKYKIGSDVLQEDDFDDIKVEGKSPFSENLSDKSQIRLLTIQVVPEENLAKRASLIDGISMVRNTLILDNNGKKLRYPFVWLRDNCQCSECFHQSSRSRVINWEKFNVNPKFKKLEHDKELSKITITWDDNHASEFDEQWLIDRNFTQENRDRYLHDIYRPSRTYWTKDEFKDILRTFEFKDVLEQDQALHDWLDCLARYGIAIIKNTPLNKEQNRKLASRVAFIKNTHYGEEYEVKAAKNVSNVAYLASNLQMHTDLPYYDYKPGVNMLHCLIQSKQKGGENLISDGFHVARILKAQYPEYFRVLSQTLVNWNDLGKEHNSPFHSIYRAPVICEDREGTLFRINHSIPQRDSFFSVPFELVQYWYEANSKFVEILHEESVKFKTTEGDILTFDNLRMVHGRTAYEDNADNTRHLIGAYLDWDEIYSRLRVLKANLEASYDK